MADEFDNVVNAMAEKMAEVEGIESAPTDPPEEINVFPTAVCGIRRGTFHYGAGSPTLFVGEFYINVFLMRMALWSDSEAARPFIKRVWQKFAANVTLDGYCEYIALESVETGNIRWTPNYVYYGHQFTGTVKFKVASVTTTA